MEMGSAWIGYAAAWLATAALVVLANHLRRGKLHLPPGPKPWPIIGNLNLIGSLPHRSIHDLSLKYGPIMQLRFGSFPVVVGSSVEMAKIFLKTMDINFLDRPKTAAGKYTAYNYSDMTWSQYGPYWRQARRMCTVELFSTKRLDSYEYIRSEELKSILYNLYERSCSSPGQPIILKDYLSTLSLNIISRMVLGKNYLKQINDIVSPEEFKKMIEEWFVLNGVLDIGDSIPWIAFMDVQGNVKKMKDLGKRFDRFLEHVLEDHIDRMVTEGDKFVAMDMVDVLLQLADNPSNEVKIGRDGVKGFTQDLLTGGTESSAMTVEWAMSELLKKPETLMKAIKELDRVIGKDQWVEEKDMLNLPYIQAIVKETMRLHPVAPMLAPHQCREDSKVTGYDVPKGTRVLVNVWTIGRDPTLWDNPNEFIPDRFIGNKIDVKGGDFELLPFGAGRRMCPGYSLGLKAIQASLANFLHGFKWTLPDGVAPYDLNMEETFGLSTPKKFPLFVVIESRLPMHLYSTFGPSKKM